MHYPAERRNAHPALSRRACGWLNHLYRKATTADDWSEDGKPHAWWDQYSSPPMTNFPRFDLQESTYALALMCDQTPAWREVYAEILDGLATRSITFWAAVDWLTQFGEDPDRKNYPPEYLALLPPERIGEYDKPGWVANGIEPWGLQPDPIAADGNLFFKGWLNLTQSLHHYVSGEDKWSSVFEVAGVERARFEWTQGRLVEHLAAQWKANPMGIHCENTKIWTFCLSAAGLGLQMHDALHGGSNHQIYEGWLEHTKDKYFGISAAGELEWLALYYDPLIDYIHRMPPMFGLAVGFYILPQAPAFAEALYRGAIRSMGWDNPAVAIENLMPEARTYALGLVMAKEMGDVLVEAKLRAFAERHFEPLYFGDGDSEFGFWFNLGEDWPRGQLSSLAMVSEVAGVGAWQRLFRNPNLLKFDEPVIEGIDYPALQVSQAWHDNDVGLLHLLVFPGVGKPEGEATKFEVAMLPDASKARVICDAAEYKDWRVIDEHRIEVETDIAVHSFEIFTGYRGAGSVLAFQERDINHGGSSRLARVGRTAGTGAQAFRSAFSGGVLCGSPCCGTAF